MPFLHKDTFFELIRFNIVGIINTGLTYLIFSLVFYTLKNYHIALIFDYIFGMFFSLVMNHKFTFRIVGKIQKVIIIKMFSMYFLLYFVNDFLLRGLLLVPGMNEYIAQLFSIIVVAAASFLMQKFIVFFRYQEGKTYEKY